MADNVYKVIELVGTSPTSMEDAVNTALVKAAKTVKGMSWFEIVETRGRIHEDHVGQWQVTIKVGFEVGD